MAEGPYADIQKYIEHLEQQTQEQAEIKAFYAAVNH